MPRSSNTYLFVSLAVLIVSELLIAFVANPLLDKPLHPITYGFPPLFWLVYYLMHRSLLRSAAKNPKRFVTAFMAATGARLIGSLFFILVVSLVLKEDYKPVVITFLCLYLIFMVLEVIFILKDLKSPELKS